MVIFLLVTGGLLVGFGAIITLTAVPFTSWDTPWPELKTAFRRMIDKPRFQAGAACVIVGALMLLLVFALMMP